MISITRRFEFDYGHRVLGHEGKCATLHGHRGVAEVTVVPVNADPQNPGLDKLGRVIDFAALKQVVGTWIDQNWDHAMILNTDDPFFTMWEGWSEREQIKLMGPRAPYPLTCCNPTAENLAVFLHSQVDALLESRGLRCVNVRFRETPNCWADSRDML